MLILLNIAPHRLIDIRDPSEIYSAGEFYRDALQAIDEIVAKNKIPLLVGGTMMYFRVLQQGLAATPTADPIIRKALDERVEKEGLPSLYAWLSQVDSYMASRINANDSQRIKRALEVYLKTGKPLSLWHQENTSPSNYHFHYMAIAPKERSTLHEKIAVRLQQMFVAGFLDEVKYLFDRGDLHSNLPSIRSVGYRQIWEYLSGNVGYDEMYEQILAATRQLAKRQMTWLRTWPVDTWLESDDPQVFDEALKYICTLILP